jgi:hypothetical protein
VNLYTIVATLFILAMVIEICRCIAKHARTKMESPMITTTVLNKLFKYSNPKLGATYIDLSIGSRVKCIYNLAQEIGKNFTID